MAIIVDNDTRLVVQGLTGREGTFHAKQAAAYGTTVVGVDWSARSAHSLSSATWKTRPADA